MSSSIITGSIPEELRPLWDRLSASHSGSSKFIQWVLATLGPLEDDGLDAHTRTLRAAALRMRVSFLEANIEAQSAEVTRLSGLAAQLGDVAPSGVVLSPEAWWEMVSSRWGEGWLLTVGEKQIRSLAERAGANPDDCAAFVKRQCEGRMAELLGLRGRN